MNGFRNVILRGLIIVALAATGGLMMGSDFGGCGLLNTNDDDPQSEEPGVQQGQPAQPSQCGRCTYLYTCYGTQTSCSCMPKDYCDFECENADCKSDCQWVVGAACPDSGPCEGSAVYALESCPVAY